METIRNRFSLATVQDWVMKSNRLQKNEEESFDIYFDRVMKYVRKTCAHLTDDQAEPFKLMFFIRGLNDDLAERIKEYKPRNVMEALEKAKMCSIYSGSKLRLRQD